MKIFEQFDSIQGEGVHAGVPMSFIRLAGCNLRCNWCDTKYAYEGGQEIFVADINPQRKWICLTGGEPLLQQDELVSLILKLKSRGKLIEIETNGSILLPSWAFANLFVDEPIPMVDSWVIDIKLPSTGNPSSEEVIRRWTKEMGGSDQVKFVAADEQDLDSAQYWLNLIYPCKAVILMSPVIIGTPDRAWMQRVAEFCIENNLRLSLQLHKIIWRDKRGV